MPKAQIAKMANTARNVIEKVGGFRVAARACQVDIAQVYRWTYERDRGGTGGLIPAKHQSTLMAFAAAEGLPLEAADFFLPHSPDAGRI